MSVGATGPMMTGDELIRAESARAVKRMMRAAVRDILEHPFRRDDWTLQGLGMLRTYLDKDVRMHVWDADFRVPGVSMMHTHPWDFESYVVEGCVMQHRYVENVAGSGGSFGPDACFVYEQMLKCGAGGGLEGAPKPRCLLEEPVEVYRAGDTYRQTANEIHVSFPEDGTITLIERHFHPDTEHASVFWPQGEEWVSAEPRPATPAEVESICEYALVRWFN